MLCVKRFNQKLYKKKLYQGPSKTGPVSTYSFGTPSLRKLRERIEKHLILRESLLSKQSNLIKQAVEQTGQQKPVIFGDFNFDEK